MKKFFALFIAIILVVAFSSIGYANTGNVTQTGSNQEAYITQSGGTGNTADIVQFTNNNGSQKSQVVQEGNSNTANISQSQTGDGDKVQNTAFLKQVGTSNKGAQNQNAPGSNSGQKVEAWQEGSGNEVSQTIAGGYTNSFYSNQKGTGNKSTQWMSASNSKAQILQDGENNTASQNITGSNAGYSGGPVLVSQNGNNNTGTQTISGSGSTFSNNADIVQVGEFNVASQNIVGFKNKVTSYQGGKTNSVTQSQTGDGNYAEAFQSGDNNTIVQTQNGNNNWAKATQIGDFNQSTQVQSGGAISTVLQTGNNNVSVVTQ
jgi:hypothetical protein